VEPALLTGIVALGFVVLAILLVIVLTRLGAVSRDAADAAELQSQLETLAIQNERLERELRTELAQARGESAQNAKAARSELAGNLSQFMQTLQSQLGSIANLQNERLSTLTQSNEQRLEAVRATVEQRLELLRTDNGQKLEQIRATVDEKLHATLEQRLGESFKLVSDRLEQVHKGLGEMQTLAVGVGDLKRVLTNVKTRGTWGEVQLGTLLAEVLTPQQFGANVETVPGSGKHVEFAIRLPGRGDDGKPCWLPVDAKFPLDDWQRLQDALERADAGAADVSRKSLADFLKLQAKTIHDSYVSPPFTTDFAILFVPTEGLYAEMMSRPGFAELLQRDYRVTLTGPTNFLALLNSLQMGFRTLAIEQRSSEVWKVLAAVKTDFTKFGEILGRTQKKLQEASNTIDEARGKSTTIARKLREVEALPPADADRLLAGEPRLVYDADAGGDADDDAASEPPTSRDGN
jgi:DNA recombination protein RmuC